MNWWEASVLAAVVFLAGVYFALLGLRSLRSRPRERKTPANGPISPRELAIVPDEELAEYVRNRLRLRPGLSAVVTSVAEGEVRLSGRVSNADDRELAGNVARSVPRVRSIRNELRVEAEQRIA